MTDDEPTGVADLWPFNGEQPKSLSAALYSGLAKRAVAGEYDWRRLPEDLANAAALIEDLQGKLDAALGPAQTIDYDAVHDDVLRRFPKITKRLAE